MVAVLYSLLSVGVTTILSLIGIIFVRGTLIQRILIELVSLSSLAHQQRWSFRYRTLLCVLCHGVPDWPVLCPLQVSLSVGALLGDAVIHIIPDAYEKLSGRVVSIVILVGWMVGFLFER